MYVCPLDRDIYMTFTLVETHQKSWFHLSEDLSKGVDFTLVETHQKSGFHLSEDPSKGVDFTLVETHQKSWFHLSEDPSKGVDLTPARLAQLGERRSAEREVASSNPGRTNTQGLKNN